MIPPPPSESQIAENVLFTQGVALAGSEARFRALCKEKLLTLGRSYPQSSAAGAALFASVISDLIAQTPLAVALSSVTELRALVGVLGASEARLTKEVATLTQEVATLTAASGNVQLSASRMALDIAASQGCAAVNIERGGGIHNKAKSRDELHVEYAQIADPQARAEFFAKHEAAMFKKD